MTDEDALKEITDDLNSSLEDNGIFTHKVWLLWRLLYDEDEFHALVNKIISQYEAGLNS